MRFQDYLVSKSACLTAVEWVGDRTLEQAWNECERGDWMLWLAAKAPVVLELITLAACDCAQTTWRHCDSKTLAAIEQCDRITREWCNGRADLEELQAARNDVADAVTTASNVCTHAANATTNAAAIPTAADAADTAATAADAVSAATTAASIYAMKDDYDIDVSLAALKAAHIECCRLIRERIPLALVVAAREGN